MVIVGLTKFKDAVRSLEENPKVYRNGGAKVPCFAMNLSRGNGQSLVAEEYTSVLHDNALRDFCGLDYLLEYRLDGSLKQIKQVFEDIRSRAVYTNSYCGVVAIDISALSEHVNEAQTDYFIDNIGEIADTATVLFFYDDSLGRKIVLIKDRIIDAVGKCIDIQFPAYTVEEYADIVVENLRERGFKVDYGPEMKMLLCKIIDSEHVTTAKQAVSTAESLVFIADYSDFVPRLDSKMLTNYINKSRSA